MNSSLETLEGNKVKLSVTIDEAEFDRNIDNAFRKIAKEVRLPGFRAGKAPRRILEARFGVAPAREQALQDAIPQYLAQAVREHDVDLIATPEVELTGGEAEGPVAFDATCEVRPEILVPGYAGLRIELENPAASDDEVRDAIEADRKQHGELVDVERPAAHGDYITIDLAAFRDGEPVPGLNTEDWSYEIGQGWVAEDFDEQLIGSSAGDELTFTTTPKQTAEPADFEVTVSRVQELVLPDLTDEWVAEHQGEFQTVADFRAGVAERLATGKLNTIRRELVGKITEALTGLTDIEAPESLVSSDLERRVNGTVRQLQSQGIDIEQFFAATGQNADAFVASLRGQSEQAVRVDLALRAVAVAEQIDAESADLDNEYRRVAMQVSQKPSQVRKAYETNNMVPELTAQIRKSKALDWLVHHVEFVDQSGAPLDREMILGAGEGSASDEPDAARGHSAAEAEPAVLRSDLEASGNASRSEAGTHP